MRMPREWSEPGVGEPKRAGRPSGPWLPQTRPRSGRAFMISKANASSRRHRQIACKIDRLAGGGAWRRSA
jgi:hypothetical protein